MRNQVKHTLLLLICILLISNLTFAKEEKTDGTDPMESFGDVNENYSSDQRSEVSNLNINQKIRFRHLSGTYTSDYQESSSLTSLIIWYDLGVGQSVYKYKISRNSVSQLL